MIIKRLRINNKKFKKSFLEAGLLFSGCGINCKQTQIIFKMKKLLVVLAIGAFAACNTGTSTDNTTDSLKDAVDSTKDAKVDMVDSTKDAVDSSLKAAKDSIKSDAKAAKDSIKGK